MARKLKYTGTENYQGRRPFVPGYPAMDFTCESDKEAEELVKNSGCYEYATEKVDEKKEGGDK